MCVHAYTHTPHKQTYMGKCAPTHPSPMWSPFRVGAQGQAFDRYIPALSPPPVETHFSITGGCKGLKTWAEEGPGSREVRRDAIPAGMPRLQVTAPSCSSFPSSLVNCCLPPGQVMRHRNGALPWRGVGRPLAAGSALAFGAN